MSWCRAKPDLKRRLNIGLKSVRWLETQLFMNADVTLSAGHVNMQPQRAEVFGLLLSPWNWLENLCQISNSHTPPFAVVKSGLT